MSNMALGISGCWKSPIRRISPQRDLYQSFQAARPSHTMNIHISVVRNTCVTFVEVGLWVSSQIFSHLEEGYCNDHSHVTRRSYLMVFTISVNQEHDLVSACCQAKQQSTIGVLT